LKAVLIPDNNNKVSLQEFSNLLAYFGPLNYGEDLLNAVDNVTKKAWFFGGLTTKDAELLLASKKVGTFLVRLSTTNPGSYSVSIMHKTNRVRHLRVNRTKELKYEYDTKLYASLDEFLAATQRSLGLKAVCPGSPFVKIYSQNEGATPEQESEYMSGYLQSYDG